VDSLPHAKNKGLSAVQFATFPAWHSGSELVNLIQLIGGSGGLIMRSLGLVLVLCGAAALIGTPGVASAFETQGSGDPIDGQSLLAQPQGFAQDLKAHSLAMPLSGKSDGGGFVSSYGNSIPIPGPGIDQPAPAWALSPGGIALH
jgi:hypothetical protein